MKILLIEDEKISRIILNDTLTKEGYEVTPCETGLKGLEHLDSNKFDVVITDLRLPSMNGIDIVKAAKEKNKDCTVIVITAYATVETAVAALKLGAYDYLTKPFSPDKLLSMLKNIRQLNDVITENMRLRNRIQRYENHTIIGNSLIMQKLMTTLRSVAPTDHTILIEGESGTGKELVALTLHRFSERNNGPFIAVNCASLPETLLESELFGHEKGAFTGALRRHKGYIERAHGGTLFIDDIDDLPFRLQVKLIRVLQEREVQPIGGSINIPVDFRVICATKVNLFQMVKEGKFREDLYYRLNIIPITVPPLRDRKEDLPILIDHFIEKYQKGKTPPKLSTRQLDKMMDYDWPGNVRELENVIQRMLALPYDINNYHFDWVPTTAEKADAEAEKKDDEFEAIQSFDAYIQSREREIIDWALDKSHNNISNAARLLQLPRSTLHSKMEKLNYFDEKGEYE
ncbi:sigma-54-dependent Fis family transcriptional regulator [candidate division KSB1 bacterium]|nr:sigma-54-dependent Fis family transcriptional regulator [candidate division KSB1 bacterium]